MVPMSWTPGIAFGGASVGVTYSLQSGSYVRVGDLVTCFFRLTLTSKGTSTGTVTITGLPFAIAGTSEAYAGSGSLSTSSGLASITGALSSGAGATGASVFNLFMQGASGNAPIADTNITNALALTGTFTYRAA